MSTQPINASAFASPRYDGTGAAENGNMRTVQGTTSSIASMAGNSGTAGISAEVLAMAVQLVNASKIANAQQSITFPDGSTYLGETRDGQPHGRGVMQYARQKDPSYQRYEGEFVNGLRQGQGTMSWTNGNIYEGGWENNDRQGRGHIIYADGRDYQGAYDKNQIHGQGVMRYPDGGVYSGSWERTSAHGEGKRTYPDGSYDEGNFRQGQLLEGTRYIMGFNNIGHLNTVKNGRVDNGCCTIL
ncbi:MAG TPA: hypothetical protein VMR37_05245 [Rhabdochlamydiaceae bacterium]|nr:hypothetical protein [Rhabdochlamydiaceae bacterium]